MKTKIVAFLALIAITLSGCISTGNGGGGQGPTATTMDPALLESVSDSCYEVVIKKPLDNPYTIKKKKQEGRADEIVLDPIVYEKELPWTGVSYTIRNDEYNSIGTAFAISETEFVTAAHVLSLEDKVLWTDYYIRDGKGNVYELDQVKKYANHQDYALFTAKKEPNTSFLKLNKQYSLNSKTYAVGNAFGEGIVIRDGLLTSTTKEEENGEWDFLRFSAAASPGNSGGPLINEAGEVIGIVLRKSKDENLNYALPIKELLNAKNNTAFLHRFSQYSLLITSNNYGPYVYDKEVKLPLYYKDLRNELVKLNQEITQEQMAGILEENKDNLFPNGEGSARLLHNTSNIGFPCLASENKDDGVWSIYRPKELEKGQLKDNGYLRYGSISSLGFFEMRKPDTMSLDEILEDSKLFMDTFLKAYPLNRPIGGQQIRIKSLGEPVERYEHTDRYDRKWIVEVWDLLFIDAKLMFFSLPVPDGRVGYFQLNHTHRIDDDLLVDTKEYTNYTFYSYYGTFKQWKEFFKQTKYLPQTLKDIKFSYDSNKASIKSNRFDVNYTKDAFNITDDSLMTIKINPFKDKGKVVWDMNSLVIYEDKNDANYFAITRKYEPEDTLPEDYEDHWNDITKARHPFNGEPSTEDGDTFILSLHSKYLDMERSERKNQKVIYTVNIGLEGEIEDEEIEAKLELFDKAITLKE